MRYVTDEMIDANKIIEAINGIEQDIYESTGGVEYFNITLTSNGFMDIVEFCGIVLWDSDDDCRCYYEGDNEDYWNIRERLGDCIRRRLEEELTKLATIKV